LLADDLFNLLLAWNRDTVALREIDDLTVKYIPRGKL
jgi:hypothetical protein